mgnify:CR=1 FL=1
MPITHAPIGRIKKPKAKTAAACNNLTVLSPSGKNRGAKYKVNAAYTYQSYHSTRLPAEPPKIDLNRVLLSRGGAITSEDI